jgi:hypothetical protein
MAVCSWKGFHYLTVIPDVNKAFNIHWVVLQQSICYF